MRQVTKKVTHLLLLALGNDHHNPSAPFASGAAHPLHKSNRTLVGIKANDEINFPNVEPFLPHTRGHKCIVATLPEFPDNLEDKESVVLLSVTPPLSTSHHLTILFLRF